MNIALIGYGKMGKQVHEICLSRKHQISGIANNEREIEKALEHAHVAIDFTTPTSVFYSMDYCIKNKIPLVVGTTGWYQRLDEVKERVIKENASVFYASNFSIGANLFFKISEQSSHLMKKFVKSGLFATSIEETHHTQKLDFPSGTAITLLNSVKKELDFLPDPKIENVNEAIAKEKNSDFFIRSIRSGSVVGEHKLIFQSEVDRIEIKHEAFNRKGFAEGSVLAAEWLIGKSGFYGMDDLLGL